MTSEDLFKNPFTDYNANVMDSKKILDYWCSPFAFLRSVPILESDVYCDAMPIVFMGGRGTGKTMFLKYFSYITQRDQALREIQNGNFDTILSYLKTKGGIGLYLRFDGPILRSFQEKGVQQEKWDNIFTHYFELYLCKLYLKVIKDLTERGEFDEGQINSKFVPEVARKLGKSDGVSRNISGLLDIVEDLLDEVASFRADIAFIDKDFCPTKAFSSQDLSYGIAEIALDTIMEIKDGINFIIFIDEYENYLIGQQVIVNTLLKFVRKGITFRIGMRLQGFHTFSTVSPNEFIKEGRDYSKLVFEDVLKKDKDYQQFLSSIAKKRLESNPHFRQKNYLDISNFLGNREDLEKEANNLIKGKENQTKHFNLLISLVDEESIKEIREILSNPEHPLLEMLNILWFLRNNKPEQIRKAMNGYIKEDKSEEVKKYRRDYIDKYKLSLMFLLASAYHVRKMYYSFNTFCYLSSGIVGNFIELCRKSFQYAYFEDRETLFEKGEISPELQSTAVRDLANSEMENVNRIPKYGSEIYTFVKNLGNIFREYHGDIFIRYPETNQFSIDMSSIDDKETRDAFNAAIEWSSIQKKSGLQQDVPGGYRTEVYTLNRVFSPLFDITYRTRGGISEKYDASHLKILMTHENVKPQANLNKAPRTVNVTQKRLI